MIYYERDINKAIDETIAECIGEGYMPPYAINSRRCGLYLVKGEDAICIERNLTHDEDCMLGIIEVVILHGYLTERWNDFHESSREVVRRFYSIPRSNGAYTDDSALCYNAINKHSERMHDLVRQSVVKSEVMTDVRVYRAFLAFLRKQKGFRRAKLSDIQSITREGNVYRGTVLKDGAKRFLMFDRKELCK